MRSNNDKANLSSRLLADAEAKQWLHNCVGGTATAVDHVQTLWSGYGEIVRVHLDNAEVKSAIVKWVEPPKHMDHPRGWTGHASHERKLRSYEVEQCFYSQWSKTVASDSRVAACFAAESTDLGWRFLLEDLDASGYPRRCMSLSRDQIDDCLNWLASFHATFIGCQPEGLWDTGTYWHLKTRKDEWNALEDQQLKQAAAPLDKALNNCRFQTLVHGDAKVANFCFGIAEVAAVDFQYVGGGCGIKDVAYFLSSCLTDKECEAQAPGHLDRYFSCLRNQLEQKKDGTIDIDSLIEEWRSLYPAAWADFHRFLAGWAPSHWKIHRYTRRMTSEALAQLA